LIVVVILEVVLEGLVLVVGLAVETDGFAAVIAIAGNPFGRAQGIR